jgi:hypothetical protein
MDMITARNYQDALDAQSAPNLSGLAHTLSDVISELWKEAHAMGHGTHWVNTHPIVKLYVGQMAELCRIGVLDPDVYLEAYKTCQEKAGVIDGSV